MKKFVLVFGLFTLFFAVPVSAEVNFSVANISQDNADATQIGVRSGDVLRYELAVSGESLLSESAETNIDLTDILRHTTMVNSGGGTLTENALTFPAGFCLTCDGQVFSFFVRANEECVTGETVDATYEGQSLTVPFHCELTESGPTPLIVAIVALFLFMGYTLLSWKQT